MLGHTYGWRARLGIILPSLNVTTEPEYYRMVPEGVTVHTMRMPVEKETEETYRNMLTTLPERVKCIAHARPHALAFACTSGSLFGGSGYDQELIEVMKQAVSCPCTTTTTAVVEALRASGVKRVCIGTPYPSWINELEKKFLEGAGFTVARVISIRQDLVDIFGIEHDVTNPQFAHLVNAVPPERVYQFAIERVNGESCDAVFLSCMGLPTLGVIGLLEQTLGKAVISSNQVTLWKLLRMAGIPAEDSMAQFGSLFTR